MKKINKYWTRASKFNIWNTYPFFNNNNNWIGENKIAIWINLINI